MRWFAILAAVAALVAPVAVFAHCDTMDGPVVAAAKLALEKGEVTATLKWVKPEQEKEIRTLFQKTLLVRKLNAEAKELADLYFFETLVRVHRASEGEPYMKPAGTAVEPGVAAADKAIAKGDAASLVKDINEQTAAGIQKRFARVIETQKHAEESVTAGREYVAAYVEFVHYVEHLHATAEGTAAGAKEHE